MTGEADAVRALTLLIAVCEQTLAALEAVDPPCDRALAEHAEKVRDLSMVELQFGRFAKRQS